MILEIEYKFWDRFVKKLERFFNLRCRVGKAAYRAWAAVNQGVAKVVKIIKKPKKLKVSIRRNSFMEVYKKIQEVGFFTFLAVLKILNV